MFEALAVLFQALGVLASEEIIRESVLVLYRLSSQCYLIMRSL
jgi:hypothetical protein